jgi:hypothetical protein
VGAIGPDSRDTAKRLDQVPDPRCRLTITKFPATTSMFLGSKVTTGAFHAGTVRTPVGTSNPIVSLSACASAHKQQVCPLAAIR